MRLVLGSLLTLVLFGSLGSCRCGGGATPAADRDSAAGHRPAATGGVPGEQVVCPVCGLRFGAEETVATHEHNGRTYHFLLEDHRDAFAADPSAYLEKPRPRDTALPQDAGNK